MKKTILQMPLFLLMLGASAIAMYVPAVYAVVTRDFHVARSFFYSGTLLIAVVSLIAIAINGHRRTPTSLHHLFAVFCAFTVLPLFLAVPFFEGVRTTSFLNAYFEMVSSVTTTGTTIFDPPDRLSPALHLWRGQVAWMGGLMMWIAAAAVFSPLNLGGFEVTARSDLGQADSMRGHMVKADPMKRWERSAIVLVPIYSGLTLALWVMLLVLGDTSLSGLIHAMSVMSTSGISMVGGVKNATSGLAGEVVIFLFLMFALSRLTFSNDTGMLGRTSLLQDPEFRLGVFLVILVPILLFLRHWLAAFEVNDLKDFGAALKAGWGAIFTVLNFLTTTGFESSEWHTARDWSGLDTPGMILMGLTIIGGGVATTAGGVKLLRVYVLYVQGVGEMEKLVHPSIVVGSKKETRHIRRKGATIAWVFFMLVAMSIALIAILLAAFGVSFENAMVLSISAMSTTGPLAQIAAQDPIEIATLGGGVKVVLCAAMVIGRLETLAIIALLSPELWHK